MDTNVIANFAIIPALSSYLYCNDPGFTKTRYSYSIYQELNYATKEPDNSKSQFSQL